MNVAKCPKLYTIYISLLKELIGHWKKWIIRLYFFQLRKWIFMYAKGWESRLNKHEVSMRERIMVICCNLSNGILNLRTFISGNEIYSILGVETCLPRNKTRKSSGKPSDFLVLFLGRHVSTPRIEEISFPAMNVLRIYIMNLRYI